MSITVTTTYTRPTTSVQFFLEHDGVMFSSFSALLASSQNSPVYTVTLSPDGLVSSSIAVYNDQNQLDNFLQDLNQALPTFFDDRDLYCAAHGITIDRQQI